MQKFNIVILYVVLILERPIISVEESPDEKNYGDTSKLTSIKALQLNDKIIILARYNNKGFLGSFTEKEGFSFTSSENFPRSITASLYQEGDDFAIADNYFDETTGTYQTAYTIFYSKTFEIKKKSTFPAAHDALNNFRFFKLDSELVQVYANEKGICITSDSASWYHTQSGSLLSLECVSVEEEGGGLFSIRIVCAYSLKKEDEHKIIVMSFIKDGSGKFSMASPLGEDRKVFPNYTGDISSLNPKGIAKLGELFCLIFHDNKTGDTSQKHLLLSLLKHNKQNVAEGVDTIIIDGDFPNYVLDLPTYYSIFLHNDEDFYIFITNKETVAVEIQSAATSREVNNYYFHRDEFNFYSANSFPNKDGDINIFQIDEKGFNFIKYIKKTETFCENHQYFISANNEFSFNFDSVYNTFTFGTFRESLSEIVFLELPEGGKLNLAKTGEAVKISEWYPANTEFKYVSTSSLGIFSFKYERIDRIFLVDTGEERGAKSSEFCYVIFHVTGDSNSCLEMCNVCLIGGTSDNHNCLKCSENYYRIENDEHKYNCYTELNEGYYLFSSASGKIYKKCYESCKICSKGPEEDVQNCEECKDGFFYYHPKRACVKDCPSPLKGKDGLCLNACKELGKYLLYKEGGIGCVEEVPDGYYAEDNIAKKCKFNCGNTNNEEEEFKIFCNEVKKFPEKCSQKIPIDEYLSLNFFGMRDNTEEINKYIKMNEKMKEKTLNKVLDNISSSKENITTEMNDDINFIIQILEVSESFKENKELIQKLIANISKIFTCEEIEKFFENENDLAVLSAALTVYTLLSKKYYLSFQELSVLSLIEKCVIQHGTPKLIGDEEKDELNQEDFIMISGAAAMNMLSLLHIVAKDEDSIDQKKFNTSLEYQFNVSIISSETRNNIKEIVENISKMVSQYHNTKSYSFENGASFISSRLKKDSEEIKNDIMISTLNCNISSNKLEGVKENNLKAKICIPFEAIMRKFRNADSVSIIDYSSYPLLNQKLSNKIDENFISVMIRDKESNVLPVKDIDEPFHVILKKGIKAFNECLFFNEENQTLDNSNCTSVNIDDQYIECICNHLTDFSRTSFNLANLLKDIFRLFKQSRIINSFKAFKNLTFKNAYVLYTIAGILVAFFILLFFTLRYDLKKGNFFVVVVKKTKKCCSSKDEVYEEISELKKKYKETVDESEKQIELSNLSTKKAERVGKNTFNLNESPKTKAKLLNEEEKKGTSLSKYISEYWFLFKDFFFEDYWFCCIFFEFESELTKTNFLVIFIVKFISTLTIATIFTDCGEPDEVADLYTNRDLAVSIITILINEIPFIIFELMLSRTQIPYKKSGLYGYYRMNTIYRYVFVYTVFALILVFGTLNTTWVSLDSEVNGMDCRFMTDFFLTIVIDCFVYQTLQLILKALIYFFILNGEKSSCLRGCLLFLVSVIPWVFNLYG